MNSDRSSKRIAESRSKGKNRVVTKTWTEETLRKAASWRAFKEGKSLADTGAVTEANAAENGWKGSVREGKRLYRVSVTVKTVSDLETRCSCPENQSSGAVCSHAVAAGLVALAGKSTVSRQDRPTTPQAVSWRILLPANWVEAITRGKLTPMLTPDAREPLHPADEKLSAWLFGQNAAPKDSLRLILDGARVSEFLDALVDHPRITTGPDQQPIRVQTGGLLRLSQADLRDGSVSFAPDPQAESWVEIGGTFWSISPDLLLAMGSGNPAPGLLPLISRITRGETIQVPLTAVLENIGAWQEWLLVPRNSWLDSLHFVPAGVAFELALEGSLQHLEAVLHAKYGTSPPVVPALGKVDGLPRLANDRCEVRNLPAEQAAMARLARAGFKIIDPQESRWDLKGEEAILNFLSNTLPDLRRIWTIHEGERFSRVRNQVAWVAPKIEILGSGNDWLSFDLKFQTNDGVVIPHADVRRLLRSGQASGKVGGGKHLVISNEVSEIIDPLLSELDLRQENGHFVTNLKTAELILKLSENSDNKQKSNKLEKLEDFKIPDGFTAELRPYQKLGAAWLYDRAERFGGALLADDMGLGKTIQTIALIERLQREDHPDSGMILVIATASLLGNWKAEFAKFAPARSVRILHGTRRDAERDHSRSGDVLLTSFGTLARDLAWHLQRKYRAVVVDEASLMRNPDTDHAKAIVKLDSARRIALTGTPIENGVRDLWSIFRFLHPGWLGGREDFKERYEMPLAAGQATGVMDRLRLKASPFFLRRTKEEVAPELPSILAIDEFCDLSPDQQGVYRELLVEGRKRMDEMEDAGNKGAARMRMLTALLRLRQTCCDLALLGNESFNQMLVSRRSAKIQRLFELLEEAIQGNHRILIFSQFQKQLLEIEKLISARGWENLRLDGQSRNRQQLVDRFQKPDGPPIFLISLKAGGYGLNLTAADTVIHFDPWWNPAAEAQATDRAHRIGQTRPVTVYRLLTRGTVEEKVVLLQAKKRELAALIDENGGGDAVGWSAEELKALLVD